MTLVVLALIIFLPFIVCIAFMNWADREIDERGLQAFRLRRRRKRDHEKGGGT
jgi:hypothetical protein